MAWRCPRCRRSFRNRGQWHSCVHVTIDDHFEGRDPALREAYDRLLGRLLESGPVEQDAAKGMITWKVESTFAAVTVQKQALKLELRLRRALRDARVLKTKQLQGWHYHTLKVASPDEVDDELVTWLEDARQTELEA